jgi:hypothetical protein
MYARKISLDLGKEHQSQDKTLSCKVCRDAGKMEDSYGHGPKSEVDQGLVKIVKEQSWELNREIVCVTTCPTLMSTKCPNPNCFNGANGIIRFPNLGHSLSYCPCEWPKEMSGESKHERYTEYITNCQPCFVPPPPPLFGMSGECMVVPPPPPLFGMSGECMVVPPPPSSPMGDILLLDTEYKLYEEDINLMKSSEYGVYSKQHIYDDKFLNGLDSDVDEELDDMNNYLNNIEEWEKHLIGLSSEVDEKLDEKHLIGSSSEVKKEMPSFEDQQEWDDKYGWYDNENDHNYFQRMGNTFKKIPAVCRHFGKHGCRMGDDCKFLHIPERPRFYKQLKKN